MKVGMLFPGYGSQFVGMAKDIYDASRVMQEHFENASYCVDINFVKLCFASSDIEISRVSNAYPALFLVGVATAQVLIDSGLKVDRVAGYGVGEYAALATSGGISFADGLYLIAKLAKFYTELCQNTDLASLRIKGVTADQLTQLCVESSRQDTGVYVAIYGLREHMVTGYGKPVEKLENRLSALKRISVKKADLPHGFYTPCLQHVFDYLKIYLNKVDFQDSNLNFISSTTGRRVTRRQTIQQAFMRHLVEPVNFEGVLKQFESVDIIVVPPPSKQLVKLLRMSYPEKRIIGIETMADIAILKTELGRETSD